MMNIGSKAGEKVALLNQRHEMKAELQRGGLDANSRIDDAAGHAECDSDVGILDMFELAEHTARLQSMLTNQVLDEHPGARSRLAIHKAQSLAHQVRKIVN
jgi:hypothetical protein